MFTCIEAIDNILQDRRSLLPGLNVKGLLHFLLCIALRASINTINYYFFCGILLGIGFSRGNYFAELTSCEK
jgi:hypothetical protein